ncbi:glycosyltransferase family 4 protein [Kamptonema cortianum]|nr:glycosyltransferase family 4 protein [Geitlerinema splendidum]MDK3162490.1 glycosyltransferase family 4 protein [Kamptonema cortianum]
MKIWIVNHYAVTPDEAGGTRHFTFAKALQERGHEPVIVASNYNHFSFQPRHTGLTVAKFEIVDGIPFVWIPTRDYVGNGRGRMLNMIDFGRNLRQMLPLQEVPHPDVILGSSPHLFAPFQAQKLARRLRVPFVLEIRDVWPQTLVDLGNFSESSLPIRVLAWMERRLYRSADHIVSLLPGAPDHCVSLGAKRERTTWIPNGVDLSLIPSESPLPTNEQFTITFAGAHGLANGLDTVLDAARLVESEKILFRLIGDGPEKNRLVQRKEDEGIKNVEFLDAVPKSRIYSWLSQSDAFVMLLKASDVFRWGVSPNKLFDYMASQRPVIFAVNSSNSPVEEAQCGIRIEPDNPDALAKAARQLKDLSPNERLEMGQRGRDYVVNNHGFEGLTDRLENVFESVLRQKS